MNSTIPFNTINGQTLSSEQISYLDGIFAGLKNRGVRFADIEPNPVSEKRAEPENLVFEERVKRELHPLDAYGLLLEDAVENKAPEKENVFRYKWHGLFYLAPHKQAFMARLRIPGGLLKTFQGREIAQIASELTTGYLQITTRANFQLRLIEPKNAPAVLSRIQSVGLHTRGAGADNIRNLTTQPSAGLDPYEIVDTLPFCQELAQIILNHREFYDLPRKFNVAFDSGGLINTLEDTNDIGARAIQLRKTWRDLEPGIYFRIGFGGATGHKTFTRDAGIYLTSQNLNRFIAAVIRVFIQHGDRTNRKRARLKHMLETWSIERLVQEAESIAGFKTIVAPQTPEEIAEYEDRPIKPAVPHPHIGIYPQKQPGLNYIGVAVPVGEITPKQLLRLCELADNYGSGELRLTAWQNLLLPNIPDAWLATVKNAVVKMGLDWRQSNLRSGLVACTGNSYCKFASANTKKHAREIAAHLEKRIELDLPINIHLTGCPHSCAQHYIGDIGLLATQVKVSGESMEGYHIFIGGGFGENQGIGRQIFTGLSVEDVKFTLERMLIAYLNLRQPKESFRAFTERHDLGQLQAVFSK